jgi:hypothetical protein
MHIHFNLNNKTLGKLYFESAKMHTKNEYHRLDNKYSTLILIPYSQLYKKKKNIVNRVNAARELQGKTEEEEEVVKKTE